MQPEASLPVLTLILHPRSLECLKDIKKFIKYYDEPGDNVALTYLGNLGILEKDLIPIMMLNTPADNPTKERIVLACSKWGDMHHSMQAIGSFLRPLLFGLVALAPLPDIHKDAFFCPFFIVELMVPMTWLIDYRALQEMIIMEEDPSIVGNLHQRLEILRGYKRAFLKPGVLKAVFAVLLKPLEIEYRLRTARDQAVIRLGLSLFRNLVAIVDTEASISGTMEQFVASILQVCKEATGHNSCHQQL